MTRMFVAATPPPEVVEDLDEFLDARREAGAFRWTHAEQWHVTLAFMESVPDRSLDALVERLGDVAARRRPLALRVAGGCAFPDPDRARVLVAGLAGSDDDLDQRSRLSAGARGAAVAAGAPADGQRFRPHLTVARLGRPANVTRWVRLLDAYAGPPWPLDEVSLVASYLGEGPGRRPRHEVVETFRLGGEPVQG